MGESSGEREREEKKKTDWSLVGKSKGANRGNKRASERARET